MDNCLDKRFINFYPSVKNNIKDISGLYCNCRSLILTDFYGRCG